MGKVTFVVGAGASFEFGFPTGPGLISEILELVKVRVERHNLYAQDVDLATLASTLCDSRTHRDARAVLETVRKIETGLPMAASIDQFINANRHVPHFPEIGKFCIAKVISKSELKCKKSILLGSSATNGVVEPTRTWLANLFRIIVSTRNFEDFISALSNINFICFNYDRTIENFLVSFASAYYQADDIAERVLTALAIYHPYGSLGELKPQGNEVQGFGAVINFPDILAASKGIRTFTEELNSSEHDIISKMLNGSSAIFFVGFGFLRLNMKLLFSRCNVENTSVYGTAFGMSDSNIEEVTSDLIRAAKSSTRTPSRTKLDKKTATDFIRERDFLIDRLISK